MTINEFFRKKRPSFYLMAASGLFGLIALIMYALSVKMSFYEAAFTTELSAFVIILFVVSIAGAGVSLWREIDLLSYSVYAVGFLGFLQYIIANASYLASIFANIDGTLWSGTFIIISIFSLLSFTCSLTSAILFSINARKENANKPVPPKDILSIQEEVR